jgi:hypothetical protein
LVVLRITHFSAPCPALNLLICSIITLSVAPLFLIPLLTRNVNITPWVYQITVFINTTDKTTKTVSNEKRNTQVIPRIPLNR